MTGDERDRPTAAATLEIRDLHATVEGKEILKGIDLTVRRARPTR